MKKIILLIPALPLVICSFAQLQWLNPRPSAYSIEKITFAGRDTGFFLNTNGELFKTFDGGGSWRLQPDITGAYYLDLKEATGIIACLDGTVYVSRDNGRTWQAKPGLKGITRWAQVVSRDTLFRVGVEETVRSLYRSSDGGTTWQLMNSNLKVYLPVLDFASGKAGLCRMVDPISSTYGLFKTADGGQTWQAAGPYDARVIKFRNEKIGYAYQEYSQILRTTDGGKTWEGSKVGATGITDLFCVSDSSAYACGNEGEVYFTSDTGKVWKAVFPPGLFEYRGLYSLYFFTDAAGFAVGGAGRIVQTADGGASWRQFSPTYNHIKSLSMGSSSTGYAVTRNNVYKTSNAGTTWQELPLSLPVANDGTPVFERCIFFSADTGLLTTSINARVYKTVDGGRSWSVIPLSSPNNAPMNTISEVTFVNSHTGYALFNDLPYRSLHKTTDGGLSWHMVLQKVPFRRLQFLDERTGYAGQYGGVLQTTDSGKTWTPLLEGFYSGQESIFFGPAGGFLGGDDGFLKRTADGGKTWTKIYIPEMRSSIQQIAFYSPAVGFFATERGDIYRSVDSGLTWKPFSRRYVDFSSLYTFAFSADSSIYVAGEAGSILKGGIAGYEVDSLEASAVSSCGARLSAKITSVYAPVDSVWFEYGISGFTHRILAATGGAATAVNSPVASIQDLLPGTFYHMRVRVSFKGAYYYYSENTGFTTPSFNLSATASGATTFCAGDSVLLTSSATTGNQWYRNDTAVSGATARSLKVKEGGSYAVGTTGGCASRLSPPVVVTVKEAPPAPVLTRSGNTLRSSAPAGNQWYKDGGIIAGANGQSFVAAVPGIYSARVTLNGCTGAPGNPITVIHEPINPPAGDSTVTIGPSPVPDFLTVYLPAGSTRFTLDVTDLYGKLLFTREIVPPVYRLDMRGYRPGYYIVRLTNSFNNETVVRLILKN